MAGGLPAWFCGTLMRNLRKDAGKSRPDAARFINVSDTTLGRMEAGSLVKTINGQNLEALVRFYAAEEHLIRVLGFYNQALAARARSGPGGWWSAYGSDTYHPQFDYYLQLEDVADRLTIFQVTLIPGLFQTSAYRRAAIESVRQEGRPPEEIERGIELLTRRQARLTEGSELTVDVIMSEMVLHCPVAAPDVMREQMHALIEIGRLPNVSIRVIPRSQFGYPGLAVGSFTICGFPALEGAGLVRPPVVYVEGYEGALFLDSEAGITRYQDVTQVHQGVALSVEDSRSLIQDVARSLR